MNVSNRNWQFRLAMLFVWFLIAIFVSDATHSFVVFIVICALGIGIDFVLRFVVWR
jgi:hypothetical protein